MSRGNIIEHFARLLATAKLSRLFKEKQKERLTLVKPVGDDLRGHVRV